MFASSTTFMMGMGMGTTTMTMGHGETLLAASGACG